MSYLIPFKCIIAFLAITLINLQGCSSTKSATDERETKPRDAILVFNPSPQLAKDENSPLHVQADFLFDPKGELNHFFRALEKTEQGKGQVLVTQFGDSHTAADMLTRYIRSSLQNKYGNAGRGYMLPGFPLRHYRKRDANYGSEGNWNTVAGWRLKDSSPVGLGLLRVTSADPKAKLWVGACDTCAISKFEISFLRKKNGGDFAYQIDSGPWQQQSTRGKNVDYLLLKTRAGSHTLSIRPVGNGPITLLGIVMENDSPGVIFDGLGIGGLRVVHLWKLNWNSIGKQLSKRNPSLVILQYGTNEVRNTNLKLSALKKRYIDLVNRIHEYVPASSVLIIGPPDMGDPPLGRKKCRELGATGPLKKQELLATVDHEETTSIPGCQFQTPLILPQIIRTQKEAARESGAAFFDTFSAMGGPDMMETFVSYKSASTDRIHFTAKGAEEWGEKLLILLRSRYESWKKEKNRK